MDNIKWKLERISKGRIKISVDSLSKLPSIEDYKEYIKSLLKIDVKEDISKLQDEGYSPDIGESLLLYQELKKLNESSRYPEVIFSTPDGDIVVNAENFEQVFESLKNNRRINKGRRENGTREDKGIGGEAVRYAIDEMFNRC